MLGLGLWLRRSRREMQVALSRGDFVLANDPRRPPAGGSSLPESIYRPRLSPTLFPAAILGLVSRGNGRRLFRLSSAIQFFKAEAAHIEERTRIAVYKRGRAGDCDFQGRRGGECMTAGANGLL